MNASLLAMLNDAEQELVRAAEPAALDELDEDALADLHDRVRRARSKYTKLYRRRAAQQPVQQAPQPAPVAPPPPPPAAAPAPANDLIAQLDQLAQLRAAGVLTDDEFAAAKAKLLA